MKITYKRQYNRFHDSNLLHAFRGAEELGYFHRCEVIREWFFYKNEHTEYICGGLTLKECKESLNRVLSN